MTATNGAPDPIAADDERWQRLQDQLETVGIRMRAETNAAIAAFDTCLARLDVLRQNLADQPWTMDPQHPRAATPANSAPENHDRP